MFRRKSKTPKAKLRPPSPTTESSSSNEKQNAKKEILTSSTPMSAVETYGMVDAIHRDPDFQRAPRSVVSGGAESSYNYSRHDPSFGDR